MNTTPAPGHRPDEPIYLYCLAMTEQTAIPRGNGIDPGYPLYTCAIDDLTAVVSGVDLEAFTGPGAEDNLQDIQWVAPRATRHAQVVKQVMDGARVMPVRFGTLFSSETALAHALKPHHDAISLFLSSLGDRKEFAVKGFMDRKSALGAIIEKAMAEAAPRLKDKPRGARYFEEKRIRRQCERDLRQWLNQVSRTISGQLTEKQRDLAELNVQSHETGGHSREMVFNWALLVARDDRAGFLRQIEQINAAWGPDGISLESSGPWPPYSFCPNLVWDGIS